jgi:hypothetical protein
MFKNMEKVFVNSIDELNQIPRIQRNGNYMYVVKETDLNIKDKEYHWNQQTQEWNEIGENWEFTNTTNPDGSITLGAGDNNDPLITFTGDEKDNLINVKVGGKTYSTNQLSQVPVIQMECATREVKRFVQGEAAYNYDEPELGIYLRILNPESIREGDKILFRRQVNRNVNRGRIKPYYDSVSGNILNGETKTVRDVKKQKKMALCLEDGVDTPTRWSYWLKPITDYNVIKSLSQPTGQIVNGGLENFKWVKVAPIVLQEYVINIDDPTYKPPLIPIKTVSNSNAPTGLKCCYAGKDRNRCTIDIADSGFIDNQKHNRIFCRFDCVVIRDGRIISYSNPWRIKSRFIGTPSVVNPVAYNVLAIHSFINDN